MEVPRALTLLRRRQHTTGKRRQRGQAMIEFAIVVPVMMLIILGIVAFGAMWSHQLKLNNASREGARHGIVCGATDAEIEAIVRDRAKLLANSQAGPDTRLTVDIDPPETPERLAGLLAGEPLTVTVHYDDYIAVPIFGIFANPKRLVSVTTMRLEGCPSAGSGDDDDTGDDDDAIGDDDDMCGHGGDDDDCGHGHDHGDGGDCCEGGVNSLTLRYDGTTTANVVVTEEHGGTTIFSANLNPGAVFTFSGSGPDGSMGVQISIYVDGSLDTTIHTSCSRPIGPGMKFGDFEVLAGSSVKGGSLC